MLKIIHIQGTAQEGEVFCNHVPLDLLLVAAGKAHDTGAICDEPSRGTYREAADAARGRLHAVWGAHSRGLPWGQHHGLP